MTTVFVDIGMSLDGSITATGEILAALLGPGGVRLVAWAFGEDERDYCILPEGVAATGAVIAERPPTTAPCPGAPRTADRGRACPGVVVTTRSPPTHLERASPRSSAT